MRLFLFGLALLCAPATAQQELHVLAFGDSTTAPREGVDKVYAEQLLAGRLDPPLSVRNVGKGGDTTVDALARFDVEVRNRLADVVIIQFGLNDCAVDVWKGATEARVSLATYRENLDAMVAALLEDQVTPILMTPNAVYWTDALKDRYGQPPYDTDDPLGFNVLNTRYAAVVRQVARERDVLLIDVFAMFADAEDPTDLLLDGMHPNDAGHELIARHISLELAELDLAPRTQPEVDIEDALLLSLVGGGSKAGLDEVDGHWTVDGIAVVGGPHTEARVREVPVGDFVFKADMLLERRAGTAAALRIGDSYFGVDGRGKTLYTNGPLFGGRVETLAPSEGIIADGQNFVLTIERAGSELRVLVDGREWARARSEGPVPFAFVPQRGTFTLLNVVLAGEVAERPAQPRGYSIPIVDLASDAARRVTVDREAGQYLGHPTTVLLEDGRTMICVYPKGHGKGGIVMKRSVDAGKTWSERLPTPASWSTSQEVPTIHRVVDPLGTKRLILFSGLYPIRMSVSEDDGHTWSELEPIGDYGGIVAMGAVGRTLDGDYLAFFHDDGRFFDGSGKRTGEFKVYQVRSQDGGLTWGAPQMICQHATAHLCEPGWVRSPDGTTIVLLFRENSRKQNSHVIFSYDEGAHWTLPRELPGALTGDRHTAVYGPDGRLFISFRDTTLDSPTSGDWVAWVGRWEDIWTGGEGQYRVRLADNKKGQDCAYPGVEILPDGTIVTTTYGHWVEGESPYVLSVRLKLAELDALLLEQR